MDNPVIRVYEDRLGPSLPARQGEYAFNCIFCPLRGQGIDRGHHLGVNLDKKKFNCFRCGIGGPLEYLHKLIGIEVVHSVPDTIQLRRRLYALGKSEDEKPVETGLPEDYLAVTPETVAYHYLTGPKPDGRIMTPDDIIHYRIGYGLRKNRGRVIIPTYNMTDRCVYYVARKYAGRGPPYLNPSSPRKWYIFNLDRVENVYREVIVCEGVFSAIAAGRNAVATLGKGFTQEQVNMLSLAGFDRYYVAYDDNAREEALDLCADLWARGHQVNLVDIRPGEGDPDDMGRGLFLARKDEAEQYDPEKALKIRLSALR